MLLVRARFGVQGLGFRVKALLLTVGFMGEGGGRGHSTLKASHAAQRDVGRPDIVLTRGSRRGFGMQSTDYSQVDMPCLRFKSIIFGVERSPDWPHL